MHPGRRRPTWSLAALCLGVACSASDPPTEVQDSGSIPTDNGPAPTDNGPAPTDNGPAPMDVLTDSGAPDAATDRGPADTSAQDSGPLDVGAVDAAADAAMADTSVADRGTDTAATDSGSADAAMDAGTPDAGPLDAGPADTGVDLGRPDLGPMCVAPQSECAGACFNLQTDGAHCGSCETRCSTGLSCVAGACALVCPSGQSVCGGACVDTQTDRRHCGACGMLCDAGQVCTTGVCRAARACDDLLRLSPGTPSGAYIIDPDGTGSRDGFRVYCDMTTDGGGWTLVAAAAGDTNMPRFDSPTIAPCSSASPSTPCYMGSSNFAALALTEYRWSIEPAAVSSRAPIDNFRDGPSPDTNATCVNSSEYFRTNQDSATQGMAWSGCEPSEVYASTAQCNAMFRPVWNLLVCEGIPIAPGTRSSPDYNCSPFGRYGSACAEFRSIRHWRRGTACPTGQINCGGYCRSAQYDVNHCGACGAACSAGQACIAGACGIATSCADLLRRQPGMPSGTYPIDPDGAGGAAGFSVYCDMTTSGGGWTLVAAAVGDTNMPRFTNNAVAPCVAATPNAPCFMGRAALGALGATEFAWSNTPTATATRAPIDGHLDGVPDTNAICVNNTEYFRVNQDSATQGMGWSGCEPSEVYASTAQCNAMFRPVWNLLVCDGIPIAPGTRSSPDYNCSPFGRYGSTCAGFANVRHWRR